jgi:hypothetical protein
MTVEPPAALWHFTSEAAATAIDRCGGWLFPAATLLPRRGWPSDLTEGARYVWLIDQRNPSAAMLGFRERSPYRAVRFRAVDPSVASWWPTRRRGHTRAYLDNLESFAMPALWWVADDPVRVVRDP